MLRRAGRAFRRGGTQVSPPLLNLLQAGTFTRASAASFQTSAQTIQRVGNDVRRPENRGDGYGAPLLLEGAATNYLAANPEVITAAAGWVAVGGATFDGAHGSILAPDGGSAYQVSFIASANDRIQDSVPTWSSSNPYCTSFWMRAISGTEKVRIVMYDGTTLIISADLTLTTTWQRFDLAGTIGVLSATDYVGVRNASDAAARSFLIAHGQLEDGLFPTSHIDTAGATRVADDLSFTESPLRMRGGRWAFKLYPLATETEKVSTDTMYSFASSADEIWLRPPGNQDVITRVASTNAVNGNALTWARHAPLTITHDAVAGTHEVQGALSGNGVVAGTPWTWPSGTLRVGGRVGSSNNQYGRYSNPEAA